MQDYFQTTYKFLELSPHVLIPMHGRVNLWPKHMLCGYLKNRRDRESSVLNAIEEGKTTLFDIVATVYKNVDRGLWFAAASNVRLHVEHLAQQNRLPKILLKAEMRDPSIQSNKTYHWLSGRCSLFKELKEPFFDTVPPSTAFGLGSLMPALNLFPKDWDWYSVLDLTSSAPLDLASGCSLRFGFISGLPMNEYMEFQVLPGSGFSLEKFQQTCGINFAIKWAWAYTERWISSKTMQIRNRKIVPPLLRFPLPGRKYRELACGIWMHVDGASTSWTALLGPNCIAIVSLFCFKLVLRVIFCYHAGLAYVAHTMYAQYLNLKLESYSNLKLKKHGPILI
ncbi:hypothetical protein Cgig2_018546 [Carnegiea gigantea]|uniref:LACTB2 winged helix domain-containing protein n=1 Tax=Carnegiea gigantea TaxID=171969 RepID=A0A9Q1QMK2_9CARY|nr:hypothetical protein Cgig2_018546 [Carnegiea gigantea]